MKFALIVSCLMMFFYDSYSQTNLLVSKTFKSGKAAPKDIRLQINDTFTPIKLPDKLFFMKGYGDEGYTFRGMYEMPGYYPAGEMLSTESMYSTIGNLKFNTNYYFDADGQLQDGDITIAKIK